MSMAKFQALDSAEQAMLILQGACRHCGSLPTGPLRLIYHDLNCTFKSLTMLNIPVNVTREDLYV